MKESELLGKLLPGHPDIVPILETKKLPDQNFLSHLHFDLLGKSCGASVARNGVTKQSSIKRI